MLPPVVAVQIVAPVDALNAQSLSSFDPIYTTKLGTIAKAKPPQR
jgi:hypothetical protein